MEASSDFGAGDSDTPTRHSSKLSLGSSPSVLSGDEGDDDIDDDGLQHDRLDDLNDRMTTQDASLTDKISAKDNTTSQHDNTRDDGDDDDMDDLFNGPLLPSTGDLDDINMDQDSASPLSSVPDDFPLSRSVSPASQDEGHDDPLMLLSPLLTATQQQQPSSQPSSPPLEQEEEESRKRKSDHDDDDKEDASQHDTDPTIISNNKSRRLSMAGREMYSRLELGNDDTVVKKEQDDNDDDDDDDDEDDNNNNEQHTMDQHNKKDKVTSTLSQQEQTTDDNNEKSTLPNNGDISTTIKITEEEEDKLSTTNDEDRDNQQRHKEALEALTHIEVEFARLREKMYEEKMAELNEEAIQIANGTHPELVTLMTEIEEKKDRRIRTAEAWRKYQHGNFQRQFEGAEYQANVQFISRKAAMRRDLLSTTNGKRWRLEDEQNKLNDPLQKPGKLIPDAPTLRLQKQYKREEAMELQDIKDAIGFPRAPQVPGSSQQDIRDDLLLLGLGPSGSH
ncbi:Sds3-like-domain-containing protein [Chlamydoabsidia padenii]|nr:Sds3-like-domain-containing protein [Chlamydoabsidia padenii]